MIYEIEFGLPSDGTDVGTDAYTDYLNQLLGKDMWAAFETVLVSDAIENRPMTFRFICRAPALMTLKWADIRDGRRRIIAERPLTGAERRHYRAILGGRFPWE
ncbi:hypothetical protein [Asticcacaulis sp. 201]|uniref:hypothetical protein n=1 Tax=Asticcacaulis sp. 201 TaxID=3028787 RepID=UPI002915F3BF|nr:hypothetical protein [Asticcacaulis sp. 201]MDV6330867.1 hypothetical protein [Asticcacaulis sp. 201]